MEPPAGKFCNPRLQRRYAFGIRELEGEVGYRGVRRLVFRGVADGREDVETLGCETRANM
jgi:hypothetical protein